jgi:hypothetical protein
MKKFNLLFMLLLAVTTAFGQWSVIQSAPTWVQRLFVLNNDMYLGTNTGIHKSTDGGTTWTLLDDVDANSSSAYWNIIEVGNSWYLSSSTQGVYKSQDQGQNWAKDTLGMGHTEVRSLSYFGSKIFAITGHWQPFNIFFKDPTTNTWLTPTSVESMDNWGPLFYQITDYNGLLYATTNRGLYTSTDDGLNWLKLANSPGHGSRLIIHNGNLYLGCFMNAKPLHKFDGTTWSEVATPVPDINQFQEKPEVSTLYSDGTTFYLGFNHTNDTSYIYKSDDNGNTWTSISNNVVKGGIVSIATHNGNLFGATRASGTGPNSSKAIRFGGSGSTNTFDKENDFTKVNVYPIPLKNNAFFALEGKELQNGKLIIFDMNGKVVQSIEGLNGSMIEMSWQQW